MRGGIAIGYPLVGGVGFRLHYESFLGSFWGLFFRGLCARRCREGPGGVLLWALTRPPSFLEAGVNEGVEIVMARHSTNFQTSCWS